MLKVVEVVKVMHAEHIKCKAYGGRGCGHLSSVAEMAATLRNIWLAVDVCSS